MNIEIVEFYPLECDAERKTLTGTLRIKLPDIGIHLLGIFVRKNKDRWHVTIPGRKGIHHETGEEVRYPFISFEDTGRQHELDLAKITHQETLKDQFKKELLGEKQSFLDQLFC